MINRINVGMYVKKRNQNYISTVCITHDTSAGIRYHAVAMLFHVEAATRLGLTYPEQYEAQKVGITAPTN